MMMLKSKNIEFSNSMSIRWILLNNTISSNQTQWSGRRTHQIIHSDDVDFDLTTFTPSGTFI